MPQNLRPASTVSLGNYTVVGAMTAHEALDEAVLNTADYVESPVDPVSESIRLALQVGVDPESTGAHTVNIVLRKNEAGGARIDALVELWGTSGLIASHNFANISENWTVYNFALTATQIAAIVASDYDLEVNIIAEQV